MVRTALVATMRDEGPYVLEWIAYHRLIGFSEIVVCSNDCTDGTPDLLDALERLGLVHHIHCFPEQHDKAQIFAYQEAQAHLARNWPGVLMVLDADEFLNVHVGDGSVAALLDAAPNATAFLINWRIFGSSGHKRWSSEPVTHRYRRAAAREHGVNRSFKTLFTRPDAYHCPLLPHGPGFAREERLGELHPVDGAGVRLPELYARAEEFLQSEPGAVVWDLAQVNHYNTRSFEDYVVKHARGGGLGPERWDRDANWQAFDRNEEEDFSIGRHWPALERALADLLANRGVREQYGRCLDLYAARVNCLRDAA